MGVYTSIIHPVDGRELQIRSHYDMCETYKMGDNVKWVIYREWPKTGMLLDDVYESYSGKGLDDWVVIKDHIVAAVVPRTESGYANYMFIRLQYGVQELPDSEWTKEGWERKQAWEEKWKKEQKEFKESIKNDSPDVQFAKIMTRPISIRLDYKKLFKNFNKVEKLQDPVDLNEGM